MASSGGGCSPAAAVLGDLVDVRDRVVLLQTVLQESSPGATVEAGQLVDGMMARLSSALSALGTGGGGVPSSSSGVGAGPGGRRRRSGAASSGPHRRSCSRGRMKSPLINTVTATTLTDGKSWRKYGQKQINDSTNPRSYYRCTHKPDQGCRATRHVQESESNPSEYTIDYYGQHTCRDPSTFPSLIVQNAAAAPPPDCPNLISFAPINGANRAFTASTSTSAFAHHLMKEAADHHPMLFSRFSNYSSSPPAQEGMPSGSSPACHEKFMQYAGGQLVDVTGRSTSPLTVGSAPAEYWPAVGVAGDGVDMDAGAGMDSFPSSPSSPGFLSGSLGGSFGNNLCDDDLFSFDS